MKGFLLRFSLGDRTKFEYTMKVCSNFNSMEELQKESYGEEGDIDEGEMMIPDPTKGAMLVDILRWAMNQSDSGDDRQRAKWAKYREYRHPHDHRAAVYFTTRIVRLLLS
ncbi:Chitinase domain-containing protein 1 [Hordeum vulgare]|nr:Chitinase domain-containing protein 1 [Hordeum vulgare]